MSRSVPVLPYRVLDEAAVTPDDRGWAVIEGGRVASYLHSGASLASWDAKYPLCLQRRYTFAERLGSSVGVQAPNSAFELAVTAVSAGSLVREVLFRSRLPDAIPGTIEVSVEPRSERLARQLTLITGVYLADERHAGDELAPRMSGSIVWQATESIWLEGGTAKLPLYQIEFASAFPGMQIDRADFHIEVGDDLQGEFEAALTVYLNSSSPQFIADISGGNSAAESRLWAGIMRRAIVASVLADDFQNFGNQDAETFGGTVRRWATQIWPRYTASELQQSVISNFSLFEAQVDSWLMATRHSDRQGDAR